MYEKLQEEKGSALALILIIMLVITILIASLLSTSLAETKHSVFQEHKTQAHYLARSGINLALQKIDVATASGFNGTLDQFVTYLQTWATMISPYTVGNESFSLSFEKVNNNTIKVLSVGNITGSINTTDLVTVRVSMLTSMISGGRPDNWYVPGNGSANLMTGIDPADINESHLGKGMFFSGSPNSGTSKFNANNANSIFQASILQFNQEDSISLEFSGNTAEMTLDAEIIIFNGGIELSDKVSKFALSMSDTVAKNKINNIPVSILFVDDINVNTKIGTDRPNGAGFENADYHAYFSKSIYAGHSAYGFATNTRYGIVAFGNKLVIGEKFNVGVDRLPAGIPQSGVKYFYFPHNINLISDNLNTLIPIKADDPIMTKIKLIDKVTTSGQPSIWDKN